MTPQAFSYPTVGNNGLIYVPPYGLNESLDYMLVIDPKTYSIEKIALEVSDCYEKWQRGIVVGSKIYWLPYNEKNILVLDTKDNSIQYIEVPIDGQGKYIQGHVYKNKIYGNDGCNNISGLFLYDQNGEIKIDKLMNTKMMCENMEFSNSFNQQLTEATHYNIKEKTLILFNKDNNPIMDFKKID